MAMAFHRYPNVTDPNEAIIYRGAAMRNIKRARSSLLRAASQLDHAERTEAVHAIRNALVLIDDALDAT